MQKLYLFVIMDAFVHFGFHLLKTGNGIYEKGSDFDKVAQKKREHHPHV